MAVRLVASILLLQQVVEVAASDCYGAGGFNPQVWQHCHKINEDTFMYHKATEDSNYLMLGMHSAGHTGWSSLALAGNGGMRGASYVVVRKVDGEFVAEDRFALDYALPELDEQQNVRLMFASEENGGTSWGVLMTRKTCDDDDYAVEDLSRWMLWAKSPDESHDLLYHTGTGRGQFKANLVSGPPAPSNFDDLYTLDMKMTAVRIDHAKSNYYKCEVFDLEQILGDNRSVSDKHHAIRMQTLLDPVSVQYVHHLLVFECFAHLGFEHPEHGKQISHCEDMPKGCIGNKYGWAVGGPDVILPSNVGMPFGENKKWLLIQMHYYNPTLDQDVVDNSGVTLTFAKANREVDAGNMIINAGIGPLQRGAIPPGQADYHLSPLIVPPACTSKWSQDLTLIGVGQHMHLTGKAMYMDVSRNGASIGPLRHNRRFDFNHQSQDPSPLVTLKPGDQINITCTYDTTERTNETVFGDLSENEMCISFVMYYPLQTDNVASFWPVPEGSEHEHLTRCGMVDGGELLQFNATMPTMLQCVASGSVDSPAADEHVKEAGYGAAPAPGGNGMGRLLLMLGGACAVVAVIAGFAFRRTGAERGFQEQQDEAVEMEDPPAARS